jgi:methyltransferase (TIGR00027 family)
MGRALSHLERRPPRFDDPFALRLLPPEARDVVERVARGDRPRRRSELRWFVIAHTTRRLMGTRTLEIDDAIAATPRGQPLVILGAGLDARAYRLDALSDTIVFEVDHPATQAMKRERVADLTPRARELRYVPVDFTKDRLADALERAGHDASKPTTWVWEGVISYLSRDEVDATLATMASRSASESRLIATYNEPSAIRSLFARTTARSGEPHRSWYRPDEMRSALRAHGFAIRSDRNGVERAERHIGRATLFDAMVSRQHHVVVADRRA